MKLFRSVIVLLLLVIAVNGQELQQTFLSLNNTGVAEFLKAHPEYDGRGTIVLVLDTGVDMGIDGLTVTPDGEKKVIDVQDFTGQGDLPYYEADTDEIEFNGKDVEGFVNEDKGLKVAGAGQLSLKSVDDKYFIGVIDEQMWKNSGSEVTDINGNGTKDDKFVFVTFKTNIDDQETWVVYIDLNNDGTLTDEKPIRNFRENLDSFVIENTDGLSRFTFGLNIFPDENKITLFFDDGGHGTNCAGIATGYRIGDSQFNGVAPGAKLMGLKIGNNNYSGGATVAESMEKAYKYADKISKEREEPCIINMSFGIGSEIEGRADIEKFLDELTKNNPYLYISTSNGNEGPGLSNTGMPAATNAVLSSGAILTKEVASDAYGTEIDKDYILFFSSRGGEVEKPDVVSPGASIATIPNFMDLDRMWGTSMASPYSAGVMSLLLSAAKQEFPDVKIPSQLVYKILRESAVPIEGYDFVDQGGGYININNAYELMKKYIAGGAIKDFETYTVSSLAPNMPDYSAPNLYIRNGLFITGKEDFTFDIERNDFIGQKKFYRILDIKSSADWLKPVQKKIHFRNDQPATVNVRIDKSKIEKPGLYNAKITAYRTDGMRAPEFDMMATVVIPNQFTPENNFSMDWQGETLKPCEQKRYFLDVPAGASSMKITLSSDKNTYTNCWYFLHDPDGRRKTLGYLDSDADGNSVVKFYDNLTTGVYELVVLGYYKAKSDSKYNLSVKFESIVNNDPVISSDKNVFKVVNEFNELTNYRVSGSVDGYEKDFVIPVEGKSSEDYNFTLKKGETEKTFKISLSKEDFNKVTDFALMIYDETGKAIESGGLSYYKDEISVKNTFDKDEVKLKLTLIPAFADKPGSLKVNVKELTALEKGGDLSLKLNNSNRITLYPSIPALLNCSISKPEMDKPEDCDYFGNVTFKSLDNETVLEMPVIIKF